MDRQPIEGESGGTIPGAGCPAFTLRCPAGAPLPVLIAAPHGGRAYPGEVLAALRDPRLAQLRLEDRHCDHLADAVAAQTGAALLVAHAPRAMLDLNRAPDDVDWSMIAEGPPPGARHSLANRRARSGLGLVPRRLPGHGELWKHRIVRAALDARVAGIHAPYHAALARALADLRDRWGAALLIDLHSMPPLRARHAGERPGEFVIGDRFGASCDSALVGHAFAWFEAQGRVAVHNRPYAGGYVLDRHAAPARGVHALQVEVCRASYLDARLAEPSGRLPGMIRTLAGLVRALAAEVAALGGGRLRLAAE
ncbi:MAG: N-formylglutamate amidohydrolase [Cypionkella sp.]